MKRFAGISILLNITLLVVWWWTGRVVVDEPLQPRVPRATITRTLLVTNVVEVVVTNSIPIPLFHWSMIESESFEEYRSNLRRMNCPEWLVKEIILSELMRYYDEREQALESARPGSDWLTYHEQRQLQRDDHEARSELAQEEHDVMLQLTGSFRHKEGREVFDEVGFFALVVAEMSRAQGLDLMSEILFQHDRIEAFEDMRDGFLTPTDRAQLEQGYRQMKASAAVLVSPALFEEFWLRLEVVIGSIGSRFERVGMQIGGAQLRQLVRIRSEYLNPIRAEFTKEEEPQGRELDRLNQQVQERLSLELGEKVASEYARSKNPAFQQIYQFASAQHLPVQTAIDVFEVQQAALNEVQNLRSNPAFDDAGRSELRRRIQLETERTLRSSLGPTVFEAYRQGPAAWLDQMGGKAPVDDLEGPR